MGALRSCMSAAVATGHLSDGLSRLATLASPLRFREFTAILYLNPCGWDAEKDGGSLRIFLEGDEASCENSYIDIAPVGGRLVIFNSRSIRHAVLPAFRQ